MDNDTRVIVLLGPPGSGKGTQAALLGKEFGLTAISTGELLRQEADSGSEIGEKVRGLMTAGLLVGNELMNDVVAKRLAGGDCHRGVILDGFPRTVDQAVFLDGLLRRYGVSDPLVFDFVVSPEQVIERLSHRRQCPLCHRIFSTEFDVYGKDLHCNCDDDGTPLVRRADDNPHSIRERLGIYERNSRDLVNYYRPRCYFQIEAMRTPEEISAQVFGIMRSPAGQRNVAEPAVLR